jgi:putative transcriptional regulator
VTFEITNRAYSGDLLAACRFGQENQVMEDSLRGKLLIASPALTDPNFARSVVLMTEHSEDGAMGIVLNRPAETFASELMPSLENIAGSDPLFIGGPVQPQAVVLLAEFSDPDAAAWIVVADVGLASAEADFSELDDAVRRGRFYAGYSGWGPGQLELELEIESWIIEPPLPAELFPDDPESLWSNVLNRKGGSFSLISRMPDDPSMN